MNILENVLMLLLLLLPLVLLLGVGCYIADEWIDRHE